MKEKMAALMLGLCLGLPITAKADVNNALLKKLVDKGTLTLEEAQEIESKDPLNGLKVGGLVFFDYSFGENLSGPAATTTPYNQFTLTRSYINITKEITPYFKARITPDVYSDFANGYVVRMKYAYADFLTPDMGPFTDTDVRVGLEHTPYVDFEESLNGYRMQEKMFQNREKLLDSSDVGVSILGNIGGKLSKEQAAEVGNKHYTGRYGSYRIYGDSCLIAAYETTHDETKANDAKKGQVVLQIAF